MESELSQMSGLCKKQHSPSFSNIFTLLRSILVSTPSSQSEEETMENRIHVLKSVPVNLSLNTEQQEAKREQFTCSGGGTAAVMSAEEGPPAVALVKAEMYTPMFMAGGGLHYRADGDEPAARVIYEPNPYEATTVSHSSYMKDDQQSPPDSPYEEERDGVRTNA